jgi:hypothetical protein
MTLREALKLIEDNEDRFMGKKIGDSGHLINGFEVFVNSKGEIIANLFALDERSGVPIIKAPLLEWLGNRGKSIT